VHRADSHFKFQILFRYKDACCKQTSSIVGSACEKCAWGKRTNWQILEKQRHFFSLLPFFFSALVSLCHIHSRSIFPLPLSNCLTHHYPCEAKRQPEPAGRRRRGSIIGNVSRHMSKVQPVSWKSCVWCDSGPPAARPAPPPTTLDSIQPTQKHPVGPEGEWEQERSQQGGSSALLR